MANVQKADASARRKALTLLAAFAVLGTGLLTLAERKQGSISAWLAANAATAHFAVVACVVLFAPMMLFAYRLFAIGRRIRRARRFPAPGQAVLRDTRILTGAEAVRRGRLLQTLSLALAGMTGMAALFLFRALDEIARIL